MGKERRVKQVMFVGALMAVAAGAPPQALAEKGGGGHSSLESRVRQLEARLARTEERIAEQERRLSEHAGGGVPASTHVLPNQPMGQVPTQQPMQAPAAPMPMGGGGMTDM